MENQLLQMLMKQFPVDEQDANLTENSRAEESKEEEENAPEQESIGEIKVPTTTNLQKRQSPKK